MGLFKKLGRQAEQFKQDVQAATKETATEETDIYHCEACDARFTGHRAQFPECNAVDITPLQPPDKYRGPVLSYNLFLYIW